MIATDIYLEQIPIPDGTPEEMAQFFVDTTNSAYTEDRTGLSRTKGGLRNVQLSDSWPLELKGKTFVVLQWSCMKDPDDD